jgi:hypothetical protein
VGPRAGPDAMAKRKIRVCQPSTPHAVTSLAYVSRLIRGRQKDFEYVLGIKRPGPEAEI